MKKVFFLILLVFADQISKYLIVQTLTLGETINVLPFLDFYLIFNTGIAFSFFDEGGELGRWILVFLVLLVCLYLVNVLISEELRKYETLALLMILSGGLGNLIDRVVWGHVIDFIHFYYENYSFYIFNLADTFITIGVIIYILDLLAMKLVSNANTTS
ncbi:MAG: signal peptidase II [Pseudomonadota bacterium]|jgi:signal peptidase II|nr:signal peptidase II [Pseudomonadota bacterium]MEC8448412.1 signal peptidase II [Pseudomonadota bacterium]MEC8798534.1 signal peptidase II [Pseudomonadota bacterium]GIR87503.1 MAG: lipoprotein signal peptidase [Gammaproteobacteria bacterium]|tara:strand:- start:1129 stop:1605 length:477 start_codon:yes stop_codon:yes gene_type:complete